MKLSYNKIAPLYDFLSSLIFGKTLLNAQIELLQFISPNSSILIAGGGTGKILEYLSRLHPSGLNIVYVEASQKMIELAKKRKYKSNKITYICQPLENFYNNTTFDIIITPFLLDNFNEKTMDEVFLKIDHLLNIESKWLYTDFQNTKFLHHQIILNTMYLFFKWIAGIETQQLINITPYFNKYKYTTFYEKKYKNGLIVSRVYTRC